MAKYFLMGIQFNCPETIVNVLIKQWELNMQPTLVLL